MFQSIGFMKRIVAFLAILCGDWNALLFDHLTRPEGHGLTDHLDGELLMALRCEPPPTPLQRAEEDREQRATAAFKRCHPYGRARRADGSSSSNRGKSGAVYDEFQL